MNTREAMFAGPSLVLLVFTSSFLGLSGRLLFSLPAAITFMANVWAASAVADAMFGLGTILAAVLGYALARNHSVTLGILAGLLAHWLVYWASFILLPGDFRETLEPGYATAFLFVAQWGFLGLAFAALAPPLMARAHR